MRGDGADGAAGDDTEDTPGRVLCRVGHWQLLGQVVGEERRTWQVGAERHDAECGDATAATGRDVRTSGRCVETRQKPWAQVRREAWAARRLQALVKGGRRPQARGRGCALRREVARRAQRLANFLVKTLAAWQSSVYRKRAADGMRQWQRHVESDARRSEVEGTRRKVRRQGMVVAMRAMARSRRLRSQVELGRLGLSLYLCVRDWRVNVMKQRTREEVKMMRKERKDARRHMEARRQGMVVALRAMARSRRLRTQIMVGRRAYFCVHDWRVNVMQEAQSTMVEVQMMHKERKDARRTSSMQWGFFFHEISRWRRWC